MKINADTIADHIIAFAHEHGSFVSNLKLQKLLYYAQGWHLALFDCPLFEDRFEAWVHGPVVRSLYGRFKGHGYKNIDDEVETPALPEETEEFLRELYAEYFSLDAYELELMTHRESPWINARQGLAPDEPSRREISLEDMRAYFSTLAAEPAA